MISGSDSEALGVLMNVQVPVTVRFGRTEMTIRQALHLRDGSIVELEAAADAPVEILANGRPIARGEVVMVDGNWAVRIQEILSGNGRTAERAEAV